MNDHETQPRETIQTGSPASGIARRSCRPAECLAEDWLAFLGHRWNALVLWHLADGPLRYAVLQARLAGITPKVLGERLTGLTRRDLIAREVSNGFPREVSYRLTTRGRSLGPIILQLFEWAEEHGPEGGRPVTVESHSDQVVEISGSKDRTFSVP